MSSSELSTPASLSTEEFDTLVLGVLLDIGPLAFSAATRIADRIGSTHQRVGLSLRRLERAGEVYRDANNWLRAA